METASQKERRQQAADARKALASQRKHVTQLEGQVTALERKQNDLANELESPTTYATPGRALTLNQQLRSLAHDLDKATSEWEAAATRLARMESEFKE
jgi:ATP-binding cassette subfamily F protein 3